MSPFGSATLVLQGPGGKLKFEITGDRTSVGRTRDNEIVLQDPAVSSHHCEFSTDKAGLSLRDLNSSNGSYVNGRRVQAGPVYDGDAVKIGQFQGRIAVRDLEGKPLRAPGMIGPAVIVGGVVLVVLVVVVGVALVVMNKKVVDDRKAFEAYEVKAKTYLQVEPCAPVVDAIRRLKAIDRNLTAPEFGRKGKLSKADRQKNEDLLAMSRKKEPLVDGILKDVAGIVEKQRAGIGELRGAAAGFQDAELLAAAKSLESIFAERTAAGEEFSEQWKKYGTQVGEFNGLLGKYNSTGDKSSASELDGWRFRGDPEKIADECQGKFGKSQQDGLLKLAGVAL